MWRSLKTPSPQTRRGFRPNIMSKVLEFLAITKLSRVGYHLLAMLLAEVLSCRAAQVCLHAQDLCDGIMIKAVMCRHAVKTNQVTCALLPVLLSLSSVDTLSRK